MYQAPQKWRARRLLYGCIEIWFDHNLRYTERTQEHYKMALRRFERFCGIDTIGQLKASHIENYITFLLKSGTARRANSHLTAIKSFCRWAGVQYDLENPAAKIKMLKEDPPKQRVLAMEEYRKLLACQDIKVDLVRFICHTGLRASELMSLTWENISPDRRRLTITGKGRKRRTVPINNVTRLALSRFNGKPIKFAKSRRMLSNQCRALAKKVGIPPFGPQACRHWFCTNLVRKGVKMPVVSRLMGHSSIRTTEKIYTHLVAEDFDGVTDCLDD